jgi:hypothetical protein
MEEESERRGVCNAGLDAWNDNVMIDHHLWSILIPYSIIIQEGSSTPQTRLRIDRYEKLEGGTSNQKLSQFIRIQGEKYIHG